MCGLVGVAGQVDHNDLSVMKDLLWVDAIRGMDNTGVASATYHQPEKINLCKVSGGPDQLFYHKRLDDVMKHGVSFIIGHNRFKTHGDIKYVNAHPFAFSNLVGAHNGTLDYSSKNRMDDHTKFETDSEALFWTINNRGIDTVINNMKGSYALVWYDITEKTLNFLRNKERPLFYVIDDANATMYWASEPSMLYLTLNRHGVVFKKAKPFPEDTLVKYQIHDKPGFQFLKPTHTVMKAPEVLPWADSGYSSGGGHNQPPFAPGRVQGALQAGHANRSFGKSTSETSTVIVDKNGVSHIEPDDPAEVDFMDDPRIAALGNILKPGAECDVLGDRTLLDASLQKPKINPKIKELIDKGKLRLDRMIIKGGKDKRAVYRLPCGDEIMKDKFSKLMVEGCCICSAQPAWGEPLKFLKEGEFVCFGCMSSPDEQTFESIVELIQNQL